MAQAGGDQRGELRAGHLRPDHGGLGRAGRQQVGLGGAGRGGGRQEPGNHEDRVSGQLARGRPSGQVVGVQQDHTPTAEDVAVLLRKTGQGAGGGRALGGQAGRRQPGGSASWPILAGRLRPRSHVASESRT